MSREPSIVVRVCDVHRDWEAVASQPRVRPIRFDVNGSVASFRTVCIG